MSIGPLLRRAATLPPDVLLRKTWGFACRQLRARGQRQIDRWRPSYAPVSPRGDLDHRFDLLGSGWTAVHHGAACAGIEGVRYPPSPPVDADPEGGWLAGRVNPANLTESQRLWRLLDHPGYRPIDWQLDFKSGYRWSERDYFLDVVYGGTPGADIKVPWELARMQHLPWLAVACVLARAGRPGFAAAAIYAREIRSQILDFLASNPPRFGVNWVCPMDVAIRIANWLLTLDILHGTGVALDAPFNDAVSRAALEHGRHIAAHLEWSETGRSNHYLSDIVGLLFVAAYLPRSPETDAWLAFAIQQLETEIDVQFGADGGNYEGSTAYHCLSAELAVYAAALALGLPDERRIALQAYDHRAIRVRPPFKAGQMCLYDLPGAGPSVLSLRTVGRIRAMATFLEAVTKPSGRIMQVGDTDSGRLFKPHPVWRDAGRLDEDNLDRRALSGALDAFGAAGAVPSSWLDARVIRAFAKDRRVAPQTTAAPSPRTDEALSAILAEISRLPAESRRVVDVPLPAGFEAGTPPTIAAFPEFGVFILRGPGMFVALRCAGHARADAPSGHTHDDNLAMELQIDGQDVIVDPGSYLYTAFPAIRERYRRAGAHFVPRPADHCAVSPGGELFALRHCARATCLYCGPAGLAGRLDAPGWRAWRVIELLPGVLRVTDACEPGALAPVPAKPPAISNGYGKLSADPAYSL